MKKFLKNIDKKVFFASLFLVLILIGGIIFFPDVLTNTLNYLYSVCTGTFGWMYILISILSFAFFFWLYFGKYGNIKFGNATDKPEYSTFSWASMIFTSGVGTSIIIFGFIEPIFYLTNTPFKIDSFSSDAYEFAHMYGQFHWGFSAWAFYIPAIVAVGYLIHVRKVKNIKISSALEGGVKKSKQGLLSVLVDILVVFGIIASICTSLGLAVPVLGEMISSVFNIENNLWLQSSIFVIWLLIFGTSVTRGLEKGIKKLSDANVFMAIIFIVLILLIGPTKDIINMQINSMGLFADNIVNMIFWTDPFGSKQFLNDWTIFYWGWWLSFLPMMGIFIARISKGRTIKQVILGQMLWGTLGCSAFLGILGGYSLYLQKNNIIPLAEILATKGNEAAIVAIMNTLPVGNLIMIFLCVLCFIFLATTIDSAAFVLASTTSVKLSANEEPHIINRFIWAIVIFVIAIGLSLIGGLKLIQMFAIITGFPLILITTMLIRSSVKMFKEDEKVKAMKKANLL